MPNPPIRTSPRWSRNWPSITLDLAGSRRLATAWTAWCAALAAAIYWGCELPAWGRIGLVAAIGLILWRGLAQLRTRGGRLVWMGDGRWFHQRGALPGAYVQPRPPRRLGPVLWLAWREAEGRRYASLDAAGVEPKAWRAIKARMKFSGQFGHDGSR